MLRCNVYILCSICVRTEIPDIAENYTSPLYSFLKVCRYLLYILGISMSIASVLPSTVSVKYSGKCAFFLDEVQHCTVFLAIRESKNQTVKVCLCIYSDSNYTRVYGFPFPFIYTSKTQMLYTDCKNGIPSVPSHISPITRVSWPSPVPGYWNTGVWPGFNHH